MPECTVTEAVSHLSELGYSGSFRAEADGLRESTSGKLYRPEELRIQDLRRFEGESDPGDSSAVFALADARGLRLGTYLVAFGTQMDRLDADAVPRLVDARSKKRGRPADFAGHRL